MRMVSDRLSRVHLAKPFAQLHVYQFKMTSNFSVIGGLAIALVVQISPFVGV